MMNSKVFNLALMVLWLLLCVGLLTRGWWMPDEMRDRVAGPNTPMVIAVTGLLALWNLARFLVAYRFGTPALSSPARSSPEVEAYRRRIRAMTGEDPKVTDPQFKFDDDSAGPTQGNGHPT
jgi:hypothetical protein